MDAIYDMAPETTADRITLIMLPGTGSTPENLVSKGFVREIRERGLPVDVIAADAHQGYYLEQKTVEHLAIDIVGPLKARDCSRIWLMGISIGGLGSIGYVRENSADVEGVILLAPFLGTRGLIAEVVRAGGLQSWQAGEIKPEDEERAALVWLQRYRKEDPRLPVIYLGYGQEDRYAPTSRLLADRLPDEQVIAIKGGHDWPTWITLWKHVLDKDPFAVLKPERRRRGEEHNRDSSE